METIEKLNKTILKEYPRLGLNDRFTFNCHKGVSCFNKCCSDVNIFLTPYDIVRLKNRLGIKSNEFLEKYTLLPIQEDMRHPVVMLRMSDEGLSCPFVSEDGCTVYEDRPWSCRMYPLGVASPKEAEENNNEGFYFLLKETVCQGFKENRQWSVLEWMDDQSVSEYNEFGDLFREISLHDYFIKARAIEPVKLEMFYTVCYDIDRFREFVFNSTFLKRFKIDGERVEKMRKNDLELLRFGFEWLKFSLFGEKTISVNEEYLKPVA